MNFDQLLRQEHILNLKSDTIKRKIYLLNLWNTVSIMVVSLSLTANLFDGFWEMALVDFVYIGFSVCSLFFNYLQRFQLAKYITLISYPTLDTIHCIYDHTIVDQQVLMMFVFFGLSISFFSTNKKELFLLGFFILSCTLISYFYHSDTASKSITQNVITTINICLPIVLAMFFVWVLNHENLKFEKDITAKNQILNSQKEEIEANLNQVSEMHQLVSRKNKQLKVINHTMKIKNKIITESLNYGQYIQTAMMPSREGMDSLFSENFVIYQPKDIIGGDFYWIDKNGYGTFVAVADCTGHGVPGAMMSMLGINLLSQIIDNGVSEPDAILTELDVQIRKLLKQNDQNSQLRDGMDICICRLTEGEFSFASAQRPILIKIDGQYELIKGSKYPIGNNMYKSKHFTKYSFERSSIDSLYLYTDGCTDLFDSENKKKLSQKQLVNWLTETGFLSAQHQGEAIKQRLLSWAGNTSPIDDMLLLHIRNLKNYL